MNRLTTFIRYYGRRIKPKRVLEEKMQEIQEQPMNPFQNEDFQKTQEFFQNSEFDQKLENFLKEKMESGIDMDQYMKNMIDTKMKQMGNMKLSGEMPSVPDNMNTEEIDKVFSKDFNELVKNNPEFQETIQKMTHSLNMPDQNTFQNQFEQFSNYTIEEQQHMASMGRGGYKGIKKLEEALKKKQKKK